MAGNSGQTLACDENSFGLKTEDSVDTSLATALVVGRKTCARRGEFSITNPNFQRNERSTLIFLILLVFDNAQQSSFYKIDCRNIKMKIDLPNFPYTEKITGYGEGKFILLDFADAGVIVVHCGKAVVKPFLKSRKHKLLSCHEVDGHIVRKGRHRDNRLYWQEDFYKDLDLTVYFANVSLSNLQKFERALSTIERTERDE